MKLTLNKILGINLLLWTLAGCAGEDGPSRSLSTNGKGTSGIPAVSQNTATGSMASLEKMNSKIEQDAADAKAKAEQDSAAKATAETKRAEQEQKNLADARAHEMAMLDKQLAADSKNGFQDRMTLFAMTYMQSPWLHKDKCSQKGLFSGMKDFAKSLGEGGEIADAAEKKAKEDAATAAAAKPTVAVEAPKAAAPAPASAGPAPTAPATPTTPAAAAAGTPVVTAKSSETSPQDRILAEARKMFDKQKNSGSGPKLF